MLEMKCLALSDIGDHWQYPNAFRAKHSRLDSLAASRQETVSKYTAAATGCDRVPAARTHLHFLKVCMWPTSTTGQCLHAEMVDSPAGCTKVPHSETMFLKFRGHDRSNHRKS